MHNKTAYVASPDLIIRLCRVRNIWEEMIFLEASLRLILRLFCVGNAVANSDTFRLRVASTRLRTLVTPIGPAEEILSPS